jgi:hypothetical protein
VVLMTGFFMRRTSTQVHARTAPYRRRAQSRAPCPQASCVSIAEELAFVQQAMTKAFADCANLRRRRNNPQAEVLESQASVNPERGATYAHPGRWLNGRCPGVAFFERICGC